jgi:O-antigen/teichoic acid export membrane protein
MRLSRRNRSEAASPDNSAGHSVGRILARGGAWATLAQLVQLIVNLAFTPYLIHGFGIQRYGMFMLVFTISSVAGSFDGGLGQSAGRWFVIYAGRDDKRETTRLLTTLVIVLAAAGAIVSVALWFLSPILADHLNMSASLRPEAIVLLRTAGFLIALTLVRSLPVQILVSRQRFAYVNIAIVSAYPVYVIGFVLTVQHHWGLRGAAVVLVAQQFVVTLVMVPGALRYLSRKGLSFFGWDELKTFFAYSSKVQLVSWAPLFLQEFDTLVIGAAVSVKAVGLYSAGANFASQLRAIPTNFLSPVLTVLGQAFGRGGEKALDGEFRRLQPVWVRVVCGWFAVGIGAAYFGVTAWLGPNFRLAGVIAVVLLTGNLMYVVAGVLTTTLGIAGKPGLEAKFSLTMIAINVVLTIPLVFVGTLGVVAATVVAQFIANFYLIRLVHRKWTPDIQNFLLEIPIIATAVAIACVVGLELVIRPLVPEGPVGLLISGVPAGVVLVGYLWFIKRTEGGSALASFLPGAAPVPSTGEQ